MAFILKDRVKENSTTTGTGNISLGGAAATFDTFQAYLTNGDTTFYAIAHTSSGVDEWEVGLGTWNTGNTLSRTTVLAGSNGTSAVNLSAGTKDIFMTYPASKAAVAGEDITFADITVTGTVDGRDVAADGSKLDGIDTSADVTDAVTVAAAGALMKSGGTMTGNLILNVDPNVALGAATKQYVDTIASAGIHYHTPVRAEHPSNLNATYNNGSSGVGATLTNAGTNAALVIDSVNMVLNDRVLVANQTNQTQNGVYTVTTVGDGSTAWVLTRSTDTDTAAPSDPDAFGKGDAFFIKEGSTNAGHLDVLSTAGTIVFGTTNIVFSEVAETTVYSGGTGITLTGTTFSIGQDVATSANVTFNQVTAAIIGNVTGNLTGDVTGNADTATTLETARTIQLSGDVTGSASFDGSANINITAAVQDDSHAHVISNVDGLQSALDAKVPTSRIITAGNGLTGGGDLTANRTLTVGGGTGITVNANDIAIDSSYTGFDSRYYTETEADSRFLLSSANDTYTGLLSFGDTSSRLDGSDGFPLVQVNSSRAYFGSTSRSKTVLASSSNTGAKAIVSGTEYSIFHDNYHPNADKWTTARTLSLSGDASGSVSWDGSANATLSVTVADDSHSHSNYITSNADDTGTGSYSTTGTYWEVKGDGGSVAMTTNDGYGNANIAFNHRSGVPDKNGAACRIETNVDSSAAGQFTFEVSSGAVTAGSAVLLTPAMYLGSNFADFPRYIRHMDDTDTYLDFNSANSFRIVTGGSTRLTADSTGITMPDDLTINQDGDSINLRSTTDAANVGISFSSHYTTGTQQVGHIRFNHSDGLSYGSGALLQLGSTEATTTILADGKLMYDEGIYAKPASGTGAGTRKDANWDAAYTTANAALPKAGGTMTGELQLNARLDVGSGTQNDAEVRIYKADNNVSDHIQFYNGTTRIGEIGCEDTTWLRINQETNKNIYTPRYIRADAGFFVDGTAKGINGSGNFIGGTIAGASDYGTLIRSNADDNVSGHTEWQDNYTIRLGSGADFRMYFNGTDTIFRNYAHAGGDVFFQGEGSDGVNENAIILDFSGTASYVRLHQNSGERLRTLSGGVGVTGLTVGDVDANPHNAGGLQVSMSSDEKIVLSGSSNPYIRFQENTTDKAYIQWNSGGFLDFRNQENGQFKFQSSVDGSSSDLILIRNDTSTASGNDLGSINFGHTDGSTDYPTQTVAQLPARIVAEASETTGDGDDGARLRFFTKATNANKATDSIERMRIENNGYLEMYSRIDMNNNDIQGVDQIFHHGDTNTYMQFHAADQWRVVVGGSERLEVKNSSPHVLVSGDLNSTSDERLKKNIKPIDNALTDICQLEGVTFDWKDTGTQGQGFIAQQVEPIIPDVVNTDEDTGMKSINYVGLIGHLVEAIKTQQTQIDDLKAEIQSMKS